MAHQTEIVVNGTVTEVTEFDHTAQEIDDGIDKVNTLTGEDIPTSASDSTSISSQLSNKMGYVAKATGFADLSDMPDESCICLTAKSGVIGLPNGWPAIGRNTFVRSRPGNTQYAFDFLLSYNSYKLAYRIPSRPWREIATATPPQEFDLPLASGWSNYGVAVSRYSKDQFGQVSVIIDISNAGAIASGSTVATLPAGFRPANPFDAPAIISNDPKGVGKCYFRPNGEIAIVGIGTASWDRVDYFTAQASFVASS